MRYVFTLLIILMLAGCANKKIDLIAQYVDRPELNLPKSDVLFLKEVKWILVTEENVNEAFAELRVDGRPLVFFGTSDEGYENLGTNLSSIRSYIQQQQAIIDAYERYYFKSEKSIDTANTELEKVNNAVDTVNKEAEASWFDKFKKKATDKVDEFVE